MKKSIIAFTSCFVCSLLTVGASEEYSSPEKVKTLEKKINHLEKQKHILQLEMKAEYREEINHEVQSQKDVIEYDWNGVTGSLKNAEAAEQKAKLKQAKIHALDIEIRKLSSEKEHLLQKKAGS